MSTTIPPPAPPEPRSLPETPSPTPPPTRRSAASIVWGLVLIGFGALWLVHLTGAEIAWELVLPISLMAIGGVLLILARTGAHAGLVTLGIVLSVLAAGAAIVEGPIRFSVGDRAVRPASAEVLETEYGLGVGNLVLDLRDVEVPVGTTSVAVHVNVGELRVRVPSDARVEITASAGTGQLDVLGTTESGIGRELTITTGQGERILDLAASVGIGNVEVTR